MPSIVCTGEAKKKENCDGFLFLFLSGSRFETNSSGSREKVRIQPDLGSQHCVLPGGFKMTYRFYMVGFFFSGLLKTWGGPATPLDGDYPRKVINNDRMHFSCTIVTLSQNPRLSVTIWSACSACVIPQYRYRTADGKYKLFKVNIKVSEDWDPNFEFAFVCKFLSLPYLCRIRIWVSKIFGYGVEFELFYSASATPVLI